MLYFSFMNLTDAKLLNYEDTERIYVSICTLASHRVFFSSREDFFNTI